MDDIKRTLAKAVCWQALGLLVMTALGYLYTGSIRTGGALAITSAALSLIVYIVHEQIWARIPWGRAQPQEGRRALRRRDANPSTKRRAPRE